MVKQLDVYALTGEQPWTGFTDPRNGRPRSDGSLTAVEQRAVGAIWTAAQAVYSLQIAIPTAVINALNNAMPEGYNNTGQLIGAKVYRLDDCL